MIDTGIVSIAMSWNEPFPLTHNLL